MTNFTIESRGHGSSAPPSFREETVQRPEVYIVAVDFSGKAILPPSSPESRMHVVMMFAFNERDERRPPLLNPFPLPSKLPSE